MKLPTLITKLPYASTKVTMVAFLIVGFALVPTKCLADTTYVF